LPKIKSAIKRVEITERNRRRNVAYKSAIRTAIKKVAVAVQQAAGAAAVAEALNKAFSLLDRSVLKGVVHKNAAARYKSRLSKLALSAA
jgi:small subunit ribosomal protein S20